MAPNDSRQQQYPDQGVIAVSQSGLQFRVLFGFLFVLSAVALARGVTGAATEAGRVTVAVIFGALTAGFLVGLVLATRRVDRLEVTEQAITYVRGSGQIKAVLSREWGDEVRFVRRYVGVWPVDGLAIEGTDKVVSLPTFSLREVRRACLARGWRFRAGELSTLDRRSDPGLAPQAVPGEESCRKVARNGLRFGTSRRAVSSRGERNERPATFAFSGRRERASRPGFAAHLPPT